MDGDTLMTFQLDLFKEEKEKANIERRKCKDCETEKEWTIDFFNVERWKKEGDYTLSKLCKDCEKLRQTTVALLKKQNAHKLTEDYVCPLCLRDEEGIDHKYAWALDHDHDTGKFRGWICNRCNVGLRTIEITERTLKYLKGELIDNK